MLAICHICRLPIPEARSHRNDIQGNMRDKLALTRDHVIPRSKGGVKIPGNRKPAHRLCNERKGSRLSLSVFFVRDMQHHVFKLLSSSMDRVSADELYLAREAIQMHHLEIAKLRYSWNPVNRDLARWADDGGACIPPLIEGIL